MGYFGRIRTSGFFSERSDRDPGFLNDRIRSLLSDPDKNFLTNVSLEIVFFYYFYYYIKKIFHQSKFEKNCN